MMQSPPSSFPSRTRRIAAIAGIVLLSSSVSSVFAQKTSYSDVPTGAYYENAASALLSIGALDANEPRLRPSDLATRAELVKLLVNLRDEPLRYPTVSSFNDVSRTAWYFPYFEAAAHVGWVRGDRDCYQKTRPCTARPPANINRAEAAALLVRAFALEHTGAAPQFADVAQDQWYYMPIQTAADHCVLQGDSDTGLVRPAANMNRAEMVVMFHRAYLNQQYGTDCGMRQPRISTVEALSATSVRITFTDDLSIARAQDESRYSVVRLTNGSSIAVDSAFVINDRTVDLDLGASLMANITYTLTTRNLLSDNGVLFTDSARFTFSGEDAHMTDAIALSSTRVRMTFNADLDRARAEDESRYSVVRVGGGGTIGIRSATLMNSRTVELELATTLDANVSYRVSGLNLMTRSGVSFSDSASFLFPSAAAGHLLSATVNSATKLTLTFDTDLDIQRAEQTGRYIVTDGIQTLSLRTANLLDDRRTVELTLADTLHPQRAYTVHAQELLTSRGIYFSDSDTFVFDGGGTMSFSAMLTGIQEVPPVITTATGSGTFTLRANGLQYDVTVQNLSGSITAAHFHEGDSGISGPVVSPVITFVGNRATGTWTDIPDAQRNALLDRRIYVNVHTARYANGEIRGQVLIK